LANHARISSFRQVFEEESAYHLHCKLRLGDADSISLGRQYSEVAQPALKYVEWMQYLYGHAGFVLDHRGASFDLLCAQSLADDPGKEVDLLDSFRTWFREDFRNLAAGSVERAFSESPRVSETPLKESRNLRGADNISIDR
jgi:hypothetical protein